MGEIIGPTSLYGRNYRSHFRLDYGLTMSDEAWPAHGLTKYQF